MAWPRPPAHPRFGMNMLTLWAAAPTSSQPAGYNTGSSRIGASTCSFPRNRLDTTLGCNMSGFRRLGTLTPTERPHQRITLLVGPRVVATGSIPLAGRSRRQAGCLTLSPDHRTPIGPTEDVYLPSLVAPSQEKIRL